jgi:hypothetical protein
MRNQMRYTLLPGLVVLLAWASRPIQAADADPAVQKTVEKLLAAIKTNDREAFVADAVDAVKQGTTQQVMDALHKEVGSRLKEGYKAAYLTQLRQRGLDVHLWKLTFKDGGDDIVVRLVLNKQGKVEGFFLQ